jgi:nitrogen regulatory protein PII
MKLVILITTRVEEGMDVAQAWQDAGAPGVTIMRTHGIRTLQEQIQKGSYELPRMVTSMAAAMTHLLNSMDAPGAMLLSVVDNELVDKLEAATTNVLGDLTQPYHGILIVLDIERAIGVRQHGDSGKKS